MLCSDFERLWNEQLDARGDASAEMEHALETHAAGCESCRTIASRYQTLRTVLLSLGAPPSPSVDFVERFLEGREAARVASPRTLRFWAAGLPIAAAASLLLAVGLARRPGPSETPAVTETRVVRAIDPQSLSAALAEAQSATLELARETSAPAARIGREILGSASLPSATLTLPERVTPSVDVFQGVGDRVQAGVRPLSGSARRAFGFLLGPPKDERDVVPPT
jgi:hypothetical protein